MRFLVGLSTQLGGAFTTQLCAAPPAGYTGRQLGVAFKGRLRPEAASAVLSRAAPLTGCEPALRGSLPLERKERKKDYVLRRGLREPAGY